MNTYSNLDVRAEFFNLLFIIKKYKNICCKIYRYNKIKFKAYFSKKGVNIVQNHSFFNIEDFKSYMYFNFSLNINKIIKDSNDKEKMKIKKNKSKKSGNKGVSLSVKISFKQKLENELLDEDFDSDKDDEYDNECDDCIED